MRNIVCEAAHLEKPKIYGVCAMDGTSYADSRLFAVHEIERKSGDLRNSAFSMNAVSEGGDTLGPEGR